LLPQMRGSVVFIMEKLLFSKPALTIQEQINLLKSRGLIIRDDIAAEKILENNNYYRLEGYWYSFYDEQDSDHHRFKNDVCLEDVIRIYNFDKKLRNVVFDAISEIEISFKTQFAYQIALAYGAFPFENGSCFKFIDNKAKADCIEKLKNEFSQSKEEFIEHFRNTYLNDLPPIWKLVEIMTFGEISNLYAFSLSKTIKKTIARHYGFRDNAVFASWIRQMCIIRNVCAHHARLWNKTISIKPAFPKKLDNQNFVSLFETNEDKYGRTRRLYNGLIMMQYLLTKINDENFRFMNKIGTLASEYKINIVRMGFPADRDIFNILSAMSNEC